MWGAQPETAVLSLAAHARPAKPTRRTQASRRLRAILAARGKCALSEGAAVSGFHFFVCFFVFVFKRGGGGERLSFFHTHTHTTRVSLCCHTHASFTRIFVFFSLAPHHLMDITTN